MKKFLAICLMMCVLLSSSALAFNASRFEALDDVTIADGGEHFKVLYGLTTGSKSFSIRYSNIAGKTEDYPIMLISFIVDTGKATNMSIRTNAHRYEVACTDTSVVGLTQIETEASVLVSDTSLEMLNDIATSDYLSIVVTDAEGTELGKCAPSLEERQIILNFLDEYTEEVAPKLGEHTKISALYKKLDSGITVSGAPDMAAKLAEIDNAEYVEMKLDDTSDDVKALQEKLNNAGYTCGTADGIYGSRTQKAIKALQNDSGLEATGVADAETQRALARLGIEE